MRIPLRWRRASTEIADLAGRPDLLRRSAALGNARILICAGAIAMPFAVYGLVAGLAMPFIVAFVALSIGIGALALCQHDAVELAIDVEVGAAPLLGALLALTTTQVVDFGLATALTGPVLASLLARPAMKHFSWALLGVVVLMVMVAAGSEVRLPDQLIGGGSIAALGAYAVLSIIITFTANRLNGGFEVYERAQVRAYRHLVENAQDSLMRFSATGELLFASRSSQTLFGCQTYQLSGGSLTERIHVLDRPLFLTAFADANQGGLSRTIEMRVRRDDPAANDRAPSFVWVEVAISPLLEGEAEERHEVVALFRDISARKDEEARMIEARKVAESASNAKSQFLATIGHELRTPLNAIVGFSEMMTNGIGGELSPAHREYAEMIHKSGHHLLDVVTMLLDMSKIEAGKFELQTELFAPDALMAPCLRIVEPLARERDVLLQTDLPRTVPMIVADERACRQILINLLSNAIKFSHQHGTVTLSLKRQGQYLNISVTDTGIGMNADVLKRIGEPFFQAQDGLTRKYEGTGLGLSIVKGLVELHDGTLHVHSSPGRGTTVTVLLPVNGPATKNGETAGVTALRRDAAGSQISSWQEQKRKA